MKYPFYVSEIQGDGNVVITNSKTKKIEYIVNHDELDKLKLWNKTLGLHKENKESTIFVVDSYDPNFKFEEGKIYKMYDNEEEVVMHKAWYGVYLKPTGEKDKPYLFAFMDGTCRQIHPCDYCNISDDISKLDDVLKTLFELCYRATKTIDERENNKENNEPVQSSFSLRETLVKISDYFQK
jgi:hypothetical protein